MSENTHSKTTYDGIVVIVEGEVDKKLIEDLVPNRITLNIVPMSGYTYLEAKLDDIKNGTKNFLARITHLLIIVDADDDFLARKKDVFNILNTTGIGLSSNYELGTLEQINSIQVGVFILPDNQSTGSLETLLLQSVKHDEVLKCSDKIIECRKNIDPTFKSRKINTNQRDKLRYNLHMNLLKIDNDFNYNKTVSQEIDFGASCFQDIKRFVTIEND